VVEGCLPHCLWAPYKQHLFRCCTWADKNQPCTTTASTHTHQWPYCAKSSRERIPHKPWKYKGEPRQCCRCVHCDNTTHRHGTCVIRIMMTYFGRETEIPQNVMKMVAPPWSLPCCTAQSNTHRTRVRMHFDPWRVLFACYERRENEYTNALRCSSCANNTIGLRTETYWRSCQDNSTLLTLYTIL
jgi:hypothetical protein